MTDTAGSIAGTILERFSEKRAPTENEYLGDYKMSSYNVQKI